LDIGIMTFMTWSDDLATGIDIVDRQHHGLLDMVNSAARLMLETPERQEAEIGQLFDALLDYAALHFRTEEDMMQALGIDARVLEHHRRTHTSFVEQIADMAKKFQAGILPGEDLLGYLAGWLLFHTLGEDQTMARQVRAIDGGLPPQRAYQEAEGARLEPDQGALARSMVKLYTQLSGQIWQLGRHGQRLEEQVHERTAHLNAMAHDLARARDAAETANRAKSRFLGAISHELRTPMNAVFGFSHVLQNADLPAKQAELAGKIADASEKLHKLINDIIDYARIDTGTDSLQTLSFSLWECIDEACSAAFETARRKGIVCRLEMDPDLPIQFKGDAQRIVSILRQFADNAAKFTERGIIVAKARRRASTGDQILVRLAIQDTGIGIPPEQQARLFQAFQQLDDSPTRKYAGIGLGLAFAQHLAQEMGGAVGVQSLPGKGSLFWLDVRLTGEAGNAPATLPQPAAVAEAVATVSPPISRPAPDEKAASILARVRELLQQGDTRVAEFFETAAPHLETLLGSQYEEVARQIAAFEYDRALATLDELEPRQANDSEA
jgi:hemerythrin-like metal-binding protein